MAPQSITSGFACVVALCLKSSIGLDSLSAKYQNGGVTIAALSSECTMAAAALTEMQMLLFHNSVVKDRLDLLDTFDKEVSRCMLLFTCLEQEIRKLSLPTSKIQFKIPWISKSKIVWNEAKMTEYLSQIRGQQAILSFLIQLLHLQSVDEIHRRVEQNSAFLQQQENTTQSSRMSNPQVEVPESVLGIKRSADALFRDDSSTLAATEFDFDDAVVHSKMYCQAVVTAQDVVSKSVPDKVCNAPVNSHPPKADISKWPSSKTSMCLEIDCKELAFERPFNRPQSQLIHLRNPNSDPVIFKVLINTRTDYCVRPNRGRIEAGDKVGLLITKERMVQEPPLQAKSGHKFLFKSFVVAADEQLGTMKQIIARTESMLSSPNSKTFVQEKKIRVAYLPHGHPTKASVWY